MATRPISVKSSHNTFAFKSSPKLPFASAEFAALGIFSNGSKIKEGPYLAGIGGGGGGGRGAGPFGRKDDLEAVCTWREGGKRRGIHLQRLLQPWQ